MAHRFLPPTGGVLPGASEEEFELFEKVSGFRLPEEVRDLYRYSAKPFLDWSETDGDQMPPLFDYAHAFRPWDELLPWWQLQRQMEASYPADLIRGEVKPDDVIKRWMFNPGWIPIGADPTRCNLMLDLDPGPAGIAGQIFILDGDDSHTTLLSPSLGSYFDDLIHCLDAGLIKARQGEWQTAAGGWIERLQDVIEASGGA